MIYKRNGAIVNKHIKILVAKMWLLILALSLIGFIWWGAPDSLYILGLMGALLILIISASCCIEAITSED